MATSTRLLYRREGGGRTAVAQARGVVGEQAGTSPFTVSFPLEASVSPATVRALAQDDEHQARWTGLL